MLITKASGETVPFDVEKLRHSLQRVGANPDLIQTVINKITSIMTEGITTHEIYKMAFAMLRKESRALAARYHLKRAIMQLGPSGFPFEKFIAELLHQQGYQVKINVFLQGFCVAHETDVIAEKKDSKYIVECKYHNHQGIRSDVKVSLYFHARFQDIIKKTKHEQGWLITNTKFTDDAIKYGLCAGLKLVSWDFPQQQNLKDMVEYARLYPITCLTSLSQGDKIRLLSENILLCKTLHRQPSILQKLHFKPARIKEVLTECEILCRE